MEFNINIIIQWGVITNTTCTFPISFKNYCTCTGHQPYSSTNSAGYNKFPYDITLTGFKFSQPSGGGGTMHYIAIGN